MTETGTPEIHDNTRVPLKWLFITWIALATAVFYMAQIDAKATNALTVINQQEAIQQSLRSIDQRLSRIEGWLERDN